MSDVRCTFVMMLGPRRGNYCNSLKGVKSFDTGNYCSDHLKSKTVQKELTSLGLSIEDITRPSPVTPCKPPPQSAPPQSIPNNSRNLLQQPVPPRPKPAAPKPVAPKPLSSKQETSVWAKSFEDNLQSSLANDTLEYDSLYDELDTQPSAPLPTSPKREKPTIISDDDEHKDEDDDEDDEFVIPDHIKQTEADKHIIGPGITKDIIATGIYTMAKIAETTCTPSLNGYQDLVQTNERINIIADQLAREWDSYLGISDLSPSYQLLIALSFSAMQMYAINSSLIATYGVSCPPSKMSLFGNPSSLPENLVRQPVQTAPPPGNLSFTPAYPD